MSDFAPESGVDPGTVADFLSGVRWPDSKRRGELEGALGWPAGTFQHVVKGTEPPSVDEQMTNVDRLLGEITEDERWIWDRTVIPINRRRVLLLTYRYLKALDTDPEAP